MIELLFIVFRSVIVYLFIVIAIRLFGKREITQLSVIDLVFILLISNSVQNAMVGPNNSLIGGIVAAGSLFAVNAILGYFIFKSKKLGGLIQGESLMLIYHGKLLKNHLEKALLTEDELKAAVREHGISSIEDVDLAVLETDGNISILSDNFQRKTIKKRTSHKVIEKQD